MEADLRCGEAMEELRDGAAGEADEAAGWEGGALDLGYMSRLR